MVASSNLLKTLDAVSVTSQKQENDPIPSSLSSATAFRTFMVDSRKSISLRMRLIICFVSYFIYSKILTKIALQLFTISRARMKVYCLGLENIMYNLKDGGNIYKKNEIYSMFLL